MTIKTKLDVGDECYFIEDNRIKRGTLSKIEIYITRGYGGLNETFTNYYVCKKNVSVCLQENAVFISVDEALEYLRGNVQ